MMPENIYSILFVCVHNAARSQMAEAFLQQLGEGKFVAESAGIEPGVLNPQVVEVMAEAGIDISKNKTKDVFGLYQQGKKYHAVITVCDASHAEKCPIFPGTGRKIAWSFADPSRFIGSKKEILQQTRMVRDQIKEKVMEFVKEASALNYWMQ